MPKTSILIAFIIVPNYDGFMKIELIPCLQDNYAVLLHEEARGITILIDAPEAAPIIDRLDALDWDLTHILITHHHPDHVAGIAALKEEFDAKVYANAADRHRISDVDYWFDAGARQFAGYDVEVFDTPGHTVGHVAFYFKALGLLFSADSLFAGGCGRLFEGTPAQMKASLEALAKLPDETQIYCGHEYTLSNLRFALTIEPENADLQMRFKDVEALKGLPSIPSTMGQEKATNPYLRAKDLAQFTEIRAKKDRF
jgi:hydroxyacylglutathione hydrolase